jgi:hypothetical protein
LGEYGDNILELAQKNNKFILNMRSECYTDTETDSYTDSDKDIEPL